MSRLILNADDFGLTSGINRAILELHHAHVLTSATLMATGPTFDEAAALARATPTLGTGCHLVFVDGAPISPPETIPTLLAPNRRTFRTSLLDFTQAALRSRLDPAELTREAVAQIRTLQKSGLAVTHLDTHKHTHILPAILAPTLEAARICGVPALRNPFEPQWSIDIANAPLPRRLQLQALRLFNRRFRQITRHLQLPEATLGIAATGTLTPAVLRATLAAIPQDATVELCCHPGHLDPTLAALPTRLLASREIEYQALLEVVPEILSQPDPP